MAATTEDTAVHPPFNHHFVYQVCPIKWDKPAGSLVCEEEEEWVRGGGGVKGLVLQSQKR